MAPMTVSFAIGFVWPFIQGIYLSFCNFNTPRDAEWVGITNYVKAFADASFSGLSKGVSRSRSRRIFPDARIFPRVS